MSDFLKGVLCEFGNLCCKSRRWREVRIELLSSRCACAAGFYAYCLIFMFVLTVIAVSYYRGRFAHVKRTDDAISCIERIVFWKLSVFWFFSCNLGSSWNGDSCSEDDCDSVIIRRPKKDTSKTDRILRRPWLRMISRHTTLIKRKLVEIHFSHVSEQNAVFYRWSCFD